MAGKKRDDYAAFRFRKNLVERLAHHFFRLRVPFALGIGRIGKQQPDALSARETPQGGQIRADAVGRELIDLEVARMHDFPHGRIHREGVSLRDGMAHRNEMETQAAERQIVFGGHGDEFGTVEKAAFPELVLHERQRHGGTVDFQALDKRNQPRNRSDMTTSTPSCWSSGNMIPKSMRTHPSGVFHIWQFMPISPNPPRGVIVKKVSVIMLSVRRLLSEVYPKPGVSTRRYRKGRAREKIKNKVSSMNKKRKPFPQQPADASG